MATISTKVMLFLKRNSAYTEGGEGIWFEVRVNSPLRPQHWATADKLVEKGTPTSELRRIVETLGGAAAEYLCNNYKDPIDPSECAKKALEALKGLIEAMDKGDAATLTKGITIN